MKQDKRRFLYLGITLFCSLAAVIVFYFILLRLDGVKAYLSVILAALEPLFMGMVIAYLLCPVAKFLERQCKKVKGISRAARPVSVLETLVLAFAVLSALVALVLPQLVESVAILANDLPDLLREQLARMNAYLSTDSKATDIVAEMIASVETFLAGWIKTDLLPTVSMLAGSVASVGSAIVNLFMGIAVAIYLLMARERYLGQCGKLFCAVSKNQRFNRLVLESVQETHRIFGGFISGKLLDSLIIGVICYIGLLILKMPYTALISVVIGVTNIVPVFGPFIGAIPSAFLLLLVSPAKCLIFVILIIVLQQLDGNLIGPHILGNSMGISAFYVTVAVMLFGKLMGFIGMVVGVPLLATLYYLVKRAAEWSLKSQGLPVETSAYEPGSQGKEDAHEDKYQSE